jgi:hypothetical protein
MKKIIINKSEYELAECWSELSPSQFDQCCWVRSQHLGEHDEVSLNASRIILFKIVTKVPQKIIYKINTYQWIDIFPHLNWIFENPKLKRYPHDYIKMGKFSQDLFGPSELLRESSIYEMSEADQAFVEAGSKNDQFKLYLLMAILFRPKRNDLDDYRKSQDWNGDVREPFNKEVAVERAAIYAQKVKLQIAVGVYVYYESFRNQKLLSFTNVFRQSKSTSSKLKQYGWAGTLLQMSGGKFGPFNETAKENWLTVMVELSMQIDKADEIEALANKNK